MSLLRAEGSDFTNLDFDSAMPRNLSLIFGDHYKGASTDLLPGWLVDTGPNHTSQTFVGYSTTPGNASYAGGVGIAPTIGAVGYTIGFQPDSTVQGPTPIRISQIGRIPSWATGLEIDGNSGDFILGINDQQIPVNGNLHMVDVSRYAGTDVTLSLSVYPSIVSVDGLRFVAVPEPPTGLLLGLGSSIILIGGIVRKIGR